jgi:hypothetical protein
MYEFMSMETVNETVYVIFLKVSMTHVQNIIRAATIALRGRASIPSWGFWWRDCRWDRFISQYFCFHLSDHSTIAPYSYFTDLPSVDGRLGSRLRGYHPVAPRPFKVRALCAPNFVPPVISRGAPRQATWETSVSEGRNWARNGR